MCFLFCSSWPLCHLGFAHWDEEVAASTCSPWLGYVDFVDLESGVVSAFGSTSSIKAAFQVAQRGGEGNADHGPHPADQASLETCDVQSPNPKLRTPLMNLEPLRSSFFYFWPLLGNRTSKGNSRFFGFEPKRTLKRAASKKGRLASLNALLNRV